MDKVLQMASPVDTLIGIPLLRYLIAYRPHHYRGVVAMVEHEVGNVLVSPLLEEARIAVLALRIYPHIERLRHDHHTHRVAYLHLHGRRHVVGSTDGITSHILQYAYLADESRLVDGSAQRSEVVVQTNALNLSAHAIELEAPFLRDADGTQSDVDGLLVEYFALVPQ